MNDIRKNSLLLTFNISRDWAKPETAYEKPELWPNGHGQANTKHELDWVNENAGYWVTELKLFIRSLCSLRLNCYQRITKADRSPSFYSNKSEELFIMGIQYIYLKYGKVWIASVYVKNWNLDPGNKYHAIPRFLAESFAVHIGDHLRFGIICGPIWGSFPV